MFCARDSWDTGLWDWCVGTVKYEDDELAPLPATLLDTSNQAVPTTSRRYSAATVDQIEPRWGPGDYNAAFRSSGRRSDTVHVDVLLDPAGVSSIDYITYVSKE